MLKPGGHLALAWNFFDAAHPVGAHGSSRPWASRRMTSSSHADPGGLRPLRPRRGARPSRTGRTSTATRSSTSSASRSYVASLDEAAREAKLDKVARVVRRLRPRPRRHAAAPTAPSASARRSIDRDEGTDEPIPGTARHTRADHLRRHRHRHAADRLPVRAAAAPCHYVYGHAALATVLTTGAPRSAPRPTARPSGPCTPPRWPRPALREGLTDRQRRAQPRPPPRPARHPGRRPHRHPRRAGLGRPRPAPRRRTCRASSPTSSTAGRTRVADQSTCLRPAAARCGRRCVSPLVVEETDRRHARRRRGVRRPGAWSGPPTRSRSGSRGSSSWPSSTPPGPALMEAEVRALRAQISPHFIYNSLGAIASFVRTDPDRARELLLEFADFTRYSFRRHGEYTTLAEELRSVERYLLLEQARFGDRLAGDAAHRPRGAAGRRALPLHPAAGRERRAARPRGQRRQGGRGRPARPSWPATSTRSASSRSRTTAPARTPSGYAARWPATPSMDSVGLGNVDARLRNAYGDDYGLVVETAPGAGTKVIVRVPKFAPGVAAQRLTARRSAAARTRAQSRPARPRHRRRAARPRRADLPARAATRASPACSAATPPPRRCGCCRTSRSTRSSSTSRCPG